MYPGSSDLQPSIMPTFSSLPSLRCQLNSAPRLTGARLRCPAIAMPINPSQIRCIGASTRISRGGRLDVSCPTRVLRYSQYASPPHSPLHPRLSCAPSSSPVQRRLYSSSPSSAEAPVATEGSSDEVSARPEPPDHLDEKERAIFDRLNEALDPVALQVRRAV